MPELPPLPLGQPVVRARETRPSRRARIVGPGAATQRGRLEDSLERLTAAFEAQRLEATTELGPLDPELILVLEVAGELDEFARAIRNVAGLEFLAEQLEDEVEPDEFAAVDQDGRERRYRRQLFLLASDRRAWEQLLGLWQRYQRGEAPPRGLTPFRDLFDRLRSIRPWDDRDRLERTGAAEVWTREFAGRADEIVPFEIELWYRASPERRAEAVEILRAGLEGAGGRVHQEVAIHEIAYHGLLGTAPANLLLQAVEAGEVRWLRTGPVRFFHATGQFGGAVPLPGDATPTDAPDGEPPTRPPRIALLDGLPVTNHVRLRDRLVVDDPDGWDATIQTDRRLHGTGMASLVLHGDLNGGDAPLQELLYVRPILRPNAPDWVNMAPEEVPADRLLVDVIHEAVVRLFEGPAVAPGVRVVVLAVGDTTLQFDRFVSPAARLLDWLSFRYRVLFVVSAGNHRHLPSLPGDIDTADPTEVQHEVLSALQREGLHRRLLSPAESVNALTIGAAHDDDYGGALVDDGRINPLMTGDLPNVVSASGGGLRRATKPDLLLPGGRQFIRVEPAVAGGERPMTIPPTRRPPGLLMAAPGTTAGDLAAAIYDSGTSGAAAVAGHAAGQLLGRLDLLRGDLGPDLLHPDFSAVLLKAALAHTASWGAGRTVLEPILGELGVDRVRDALPRILGYGRARPATALVSDNHRVRCLAAGWIAEDETQVFRFPLPASLSRQTVRRRVTLTLAWLTPINPHHRHYRRAALILEPGGTLRQLADRFDGTQHPARRGTLQHDVFDGQRAVPYAPDADLELAVSCRADAGTLDEPVPFALIATVEVPESSRLPIYQDVRQRLRAPIAVRPRRA